MSDVATLAASARDLAGKGAARAIRRSGSIPAVIYGGKQPPLSIAIDEVVLRHELAKPGFYRRLYDVAVNGSTERVLARDVQRHPVSDRPLHIDFLRIAAGAKVAVDVVVHFLNEEASPGLKRGGVLNVVRHEVELMCPADAIPAAIEIDLTGVDIGDSVHISQVNLPEGVTPTIADRDFTIATIAAPTIHREEEEGEEIEGEELEEGAEEEAAGEEAAEEQD